MHPLPSEATARGKDEDYPARETCAEAVSAARISVAAWPTAGRQIAHVPPQDRPISFPVRSDQDWMKASRSLLIVSALVVGMPCGNPGYVFKVPFCSSFADSGPASA
jgi:hypothetical protein